MPLIRGVIFAAIGFAIGGGISQIITSITGEPATEPMIVLGYVFAVIAGSWVSECGKFGDVNGS